MHKSRPRAFFLLGILTNFIVTKLVWPKCIEDWDGTELPVSKHFRHNMFLYFTAEMTNKPWKHTLNWSHFDLNVDFCVCEGWAGASVVLMHSSAFGNFTDWCALF